MRSSDHLSNGKRARPSGTHSLEVPLRTCPEYAPKDAPRLDASFACSSSEQNISGVSREPLLRINAKSHAVTGEPFRAGSAPIASTATTPQPAEKSIANSAAILRRGINVRLFECSDCSIGRSGAEEVVEGHFGLDDAGMGVAQKPCGCHHRQVDRRARLRHLLERAKLGLELGQVRLLDRKGTG